MAGRILLDACNPAFTTNGELDADATLTFYDNGTTDLQAIYADPELLSPLTNPLSPNAAGQFPVMWGPDTAVYSIKWTAGDGTIVTFDDIGTTNNLVTASQACFYAINNTPQSASGTLQKILFQDVQLSPLSDFATGRHTPTVPGFYRYNATISVNSTVGTTGAEFVFYKNGAQYRIGFFENGLDGSGSRLVSPLGVTIYMNGETDYVEVWGRVFGTGTLTFEGATVAFCSFEGAFIHS